MTMIRDFIADLADAWRAGNEARTPVWYLVRGYVTPKECLLLEQLENGGELNAN
jgi:hypothetical protein